MTKLKQYLENSWYRWASQDRQTWYAAQFQYGENVNVRDMKNWVCLSGWSTKVCNQSAEFSFFTSWAHLYTINGNWQIIDSEWNVKLTISGMSNDIYPMWVRFWDYVYIFWTIWIYRVNVSSWTYTDISSNFPWLYIWAQCILNYANTYLLIWCYNELYKMDVATWTEVFKQIRNFASNYQIYWLTQEWNYLKIYTSNLTDTKIHYAKWTFDVEDTWLVQTVTFNAMSLDDWCITSDQWNDYVLFKTSLWDYKLAKISWYNKIDIKRTQEWEWKKIFTNSTLQNRRPNIFASDWVLFCSMDEWIWTFTEYNWWLWWWCVEFASDKWTRYMYRYNDKLYVCMYDWWYQERYYDLSFHPAKYQPNWFIIGRVFDGWCAWLFKKNDQATITYNMPVWTSMELSYRYDRSSFWYDKSNFLSIKKLTDTDNCYDIVVPTTPWIKDTSLLMMENNTDQILLENWNWILLEDLLVCPFNKTWNLLEYRFDFTGNQTNTTPATKTPILFEHSLTYYDYMRKYR